MAPSSIGKYNRGMIYIKRAILVGVIGMVQAWYGYGEGPDGSVDRYKAMIDRSLLSRGNPERMEAAIARARAGERVTVAFIGGSITEGYNASDSLSSYARLTWKRFAERFGAEGGSRVQYVNAGMAGTPSSLGVIRYERDVIGPVGCSPDVVIVEFAVNDGDDVTNGAAYESLVARILNEPSHPAVILLFSVFKSRWNLQERLIPIGEAYGLPMISVRDAIVSELDSGALGEDVFFDDLYHPTDEGHRIMADCLDRYFQTFEMPGTVRTSLLTTEPPSVIGRQFKDIRLIDVSSVPKGIKLEPGPFASTDSAIGSFGKDDPRPTFPNNWHKPEGSANGEFVLELSCRNLMIVYKKSTNADITGAAEFLVDGELIDAVDGAPQGSWNNPFALVLVDDGVSRPRRVTVRMEEGSEDRAFTILAFGYTP